MYTMYNSEKLFTASMSKHGNVRIRQKQKEWKRGEEKSADRQEHGKNAAM